MNFTLPLILGKNTFGERGGWCAYMSLLQDITYEKANEKMNMACKNCPQINLCHRIRYIASPQFKTKIV